MKSFKKWISYLFFRLMVNGEQSVDVVPIFIKFEILSSHLMLGNYFSIGMIIARKVVSIQGV